MIINNSDISLNAQKFSFKSSNIKESLRIIKSNRSISLPNNQKDFTLNIQGHEDYSDLNLSHEDTVKILLVQSLVKRLTGRELIIPKMKIKANVEVEFHSSNISNDNITSTFGMVYNRQENYYEKEEMVFQAKGIVETHDGKRIQIDYNINLFREVAYSNELEIRIGDPEVVDPIIINLADGTLKFKDETFEFDLNVDGKKERIPYFDGNFAYLALDLNANGKIDDGRELFGPKTGHGFSELRKFDEDKNGWIDEKDSIFNSLKLWIPEGEDSFKLLQLKDKNIGAIYLNNVDSLFEISKDMRTMGIIKKAGLYLKETGVVGQVFEIDILV